MNKKTAFIFSIFLSFSFQSSSYAEQINEFECSPDEMSQILERDGKDRFKQTRYTDFVRPYQHTVIQDVANQMNEENPQGHIGADEVTADDLKKRGQDFSCMNIDAEKIGQNILAGIDTLGALLTGSIKKAGAVIDNVMEDLSKGLCSSYAPFLNKMADDIGERAKLKVESKIRDKFFDGLTFEGAKNYLINEQIDETFGDKYNMLQWRDNKIDKDHFKSKVNSQWQSELQDLYDDFDDQVDEKIDN